MALTLPTVKRSWSPADESTSPTTLVHWYTLVCDVRLTENRSGKSSCIKSVFQNLPVKDVTYIGITKKVEKIDYE